MKKFILLIIFCSSFLFAQDPAGIWIPTKDNWISAGGAYKNFWTPANLPIDTTENYVYFYGEAPRTKVSKDSGGVSVRPYMRVWNVRVFPTDFPTPPDFYWFSPNIHNYVNAWGKESIFSIRGDYDPQINVWFDSLLFNSYRFADSVRIQLEFFRSNPLAGTGIVITFAGFNPNVVIGKSGGANEWESVDSTVSSSFFDDAFDYTNLVLSTGSCDTFYISNLTFTLSGTDSLRGYSYPTERFTDTTTYYYSQSVSWRQKDRDTIWLAAETDTVTVYPYVAPSASDEPYMVTSDGDTMFTADGDTMKTAFLQLDILEQFNNGDKNEEKNNAFSSGCIYYNRPRSCLG